MKKLESIFSPRKILVWLIVLVLAFTVPTINQPSLSETLAIVTMLCIDKDQEQDKINAARAIFDAKAKQAEHELKTKASIILKLLIIIGIAGGILWM